MPVSNARKAHAARGSTKALRLTGAQRALSGADEGAEADASRGHPAGAGDSRRHRQRPSRRGAGQGPLSRARADRNGGAAGRPLRGHAHGGVPSRAARIVAGAVAGGDPVWLDPGHDEHRFLPLALTDPARGRGHGGVHRAPGGGGVRIAARGGYRVGLHHAARERPRSHRRNPPCSSEYRGPHHHRRAMPPHARGSLSIGSSRLPPEERRAGRVTTRPRIGPGSSSVPFPRHH